MAVWYNEPLINIIYEKLRELTKNGSEPIREDELISALEREGYSVSESDLVKTLIKLELMGLVHITSSGKDEKGSWNIKLIPRSRAQAGEEEI